MDKLIYFSEDYKINKTMDTTLEINEVSADDTRKSQELIMRKAINYLFDCADSYDFYTESEDEQRDSIESYINSFADVSINEIVSQAQSEAESFKKSNSIYFWIRIKFAEYTARRIYLYLLKYINIEEKEVTPIVQLATELGFNVFLRRLNRKHCGKIKITKKGAGEYEKTIILNQREELGHIRFVLAHELGHYIFSYSSNQECFENYYIKNSHNDIDEIMVNRFAAELLMPRDLFVKKYNQIAKDTNDIRFTICYLSRLFKTSTKSVSKRIKEVIL